MDRRNDGDRHEVFDRRDVERAIKANRITVTESKSLPAFCESGLDGHAYLDK